MDGRLIASVTLILFSAGGCFNKSGSVVQSTPLPPPASIAPTAMDFNKEDDGKRAPRVAVAMAAYKEADAKQHTRNPELQFKVRDEARRLYQEAIKLDPTYIPAHRGLIRVYVDMADFERAQEVIQKAQAKFPKESIFWYEHAQLHNRKKEFAEAARLLKHALDMDPENRTYITMLGLTLARSGHVDQAVATLARSMGQASAHYNVARMLLHLERRHEAQQQLHLALRSNPNLDNARTLLTQLETGGRPNVSLGIDAGQ